MTVTKAEVEQRIAGLDADTAKAVIWRPFLMSWTLTHLRMAELGCFASMPTFSRTMPRPWGAPSSGSDFSLRWRSRRL